MHAQLYNVDSPLAEAWKYVQKMQVSNSLICSVSWLKLIVISSGQKRNPDRLETHLAHFDVAMAREQPAVAIEVADSWRCDA